MAAATASSSDNFAEDDFWCVGASVFAALVLLAVSALGAVSFSDVGAVFSLSLWLQALACQCCRDR